MRICDDNFVTKYPNFDQNLNSLTEKFKAGNEKLSVIKKRKCGNDALEKQLGEKEHLSQKEHENQKKIYVLLYKSPLRYKTFHKKCSIEVDNLEYYEVLELKKHHEDLHLEL